MTKRLFAILALVLGVTWIVTGHSVSALGLKVAPLQYKTILKKDERQKGFIDISNPSGQTVNVVSSVQAFKQINNDGGLEFFTNKQISAGIKTDLTEFELGPRQALRMYFSIDGKLLPEGDVFAAVFFTTQPKQQYNGVGELVRVGTLLSIINNTPGARAGKITGLSVPFVTISDTVKGSYSIKNTAQINSGFYPSVAISAAPGGAARSYESSLVFGGRERSNDFSYKTGYGIHLLEVGFGDSKKSQIVVTLAPWMVIVLTVVILVSGIELLLLRRRRQQRAQQG